MYFVNNEIVEQIFRVIPDIVFCIKDREQVYRSANLAFAERLGLSSEDEVIGKTASQLFPQELAEVYAIQDEEVLSGQGEITNRLELISNKNGALGWYLASKFPLKDNAGEITGLVSISRDLQMPSEGDVTMSGLRRVVDYVHAHLDQGLSTADLAKVAEMTSQQLERRMKRFFKLGVAQYVRKLRIEKAARLLRQTDKSIAEIALECGYSEQSSLTRQFKHAVGCPPGMYRKS